MENAVEVGKYTLESLTTGMYEQPLIIYREYIQNAVDSLEEATRRDLLASLNMRINISVDTDERAIRITDNGVGIPERSAVRVLMSVGSSEKLHDVNRGFRGIGRLGGLSYCKILCFETSAAGEDVATCVTFDCGELKRLLVPGNEDRLSMTEVIEKVTGVQTLHAERNEHYFVVTMLGVDPGTGLLDAERVMEYLPQVAPVGYDPNFYLSKTIKTYLKGMGVELTEFPIFIDFGNARPQPLVKPFIRHYTAGRSDTQVDVYGVKMFAVPSLSGELLAVGWYADTEWPGTIHDDRIRGLRLRKGNIQIGDERTLNGIFKQPRFNGWSQGEVFVLSERLIPNARRDQFEQNDAYHELMDALTENVGVPLSATIYEASRVRNDPVKKVAAEGQRAIEAAEKAMQSGFTSSVDKKRLQERVEQSLDTLAGIAQKRSETAKAPEIQKTLNQLHETSEALEEASHYKTDGLKGLISRKEMGILRIVGNVLSHYLEPELADRMLDEMLEHIRNNTDGSEIA